MSSNKGLSITFPTRELVNLSNEAQRALAAEAHQVLDIVAVAVLSFTALDYVTKARGGTGTDGVKWDPLTAATIRKRKRGKAKGKAKFGGAHEIGRDTGLQLASLQPRHAGNKTFEPAAVTVLATRSYSVHFDKRRPIFPETIPAEWMADIDEQVARYGAQVLETVLNK